MQVSRSSKTARQKDVFPFKMIRKQWLIAAANKVTEKNPLELSLVLGLCGLDPQLVCSKPDEYFVGASKLAALIPAKRREPGSHTRTVFHKIETCAFNIISKTKKQENSDFFFRVNRAFCCVVCAELYVFLECADRYVIVHHTGNV